MVLSRSKSSEQVARRITLRELRLVLAVARAGSILKAGNEVGLTQPALSKCISELEAKLGVRLFDRTNRGVVATPQGQIMLRRAAGVFEELRHAEDEIASLGEGNHGEVRVGGTPTMCAGLLPKAISSVLSQRPNLRFEVIELALEKLSSEVLTHSLDFGVGREPGNAESFIFERLFDDRLFVIAGAEHPLAARKSVSLGEVLQHRWVLAAAEGSMIDALRRDFRREGLDLPTPVVRTMSVLIRYELMAASGLLSIMYGSVLRLGNTPEWVRVLPIDLSAAVSIGIIRLRNRTLAPSAELFLQAARKAAEPMQSLTAKHLKLSLQRRGR
jgi:DNA-binding transcriptional LysR family regulator